MVYEIKLPVFEGPLDLLLHLIRKDELNIYDIPIAVITGKYIEYLELMRSFNLDIAGEFLVMAATLVHIKSIMLLPVKETADSETEDMDESDPRQSLIQQLLEYKKYKKMAAILAQKEFQQSKVFTRNIQSTDSITKKDDNEFILDATLFDLLDAFNNILKNKEHIVHEIMQEEEFTLEEKIDEILKKTRIKQYLQFDELFISQSRINSIVLFLALLELIRLKKVRIHQTTIFGTIRIYSTQETEEYGNIENQVNH